MLEFKTEFETANGSEPRCWLDKACVDLPATSRVTSQQPPGAPRDLAAISRASQACIDQAGDINASLKALPIFLLASRHFVVFVGETYYKRMWCVLEMFTFVRSGGTLEQVRRAPPSVYPT